MFQFIKKALFFCLIHIFPLVHLAHAQNGKPISLVGYITDAKTAGVVSSVSIVLPETKAAAVSDSSGRFLLINIPSGHTILQISHIGYSSLLLHLDIDHDTTIYFKLMPTIIENEAVVVTGMGLSSANRNLAVSVDRIYRKSLQSTLATNIIDAISHQPGISQVTTGPAISKPIIRGLGSNRLVVVDDGIRQEGQQWGDEHGIEIDGNNIQQVEIIKGPASLMYGSDALSGLIHFNSFTPVPANTLKGEIVSSYLTNNRQRNVYAYLTGSGHAFSWKVWMDQQAAADYRNKFDGYVFNSKFNGINFGLSTGWKGRWGNVHIISSSFDQFAGLIEGERDSLGRFVKTGMDESVLVAEQNDFLSTEPLVPFQHIRHQKIIMDDHFSIGKGKLSVLAGFQRNRRSEFGDATAPDIPELFFDLKTFNYRLNYRFHQGRNWYHDIGMSGMNQMNRNRGLERLIPDYHLFDIGGYLHSEKKFRSTTLSGGVRWDRRQLGANAYQMSPDSLFPGLRRTFSDYSFSAGMIHIFPGSWVLKANFAKGFRAPALSELASYGTHEGTRRFEYGQAQLKTELSYQTDLSLEFSSAHFVTTASIFYTALNRFVFYSKLRSANGADSLMEVDGETIPAFAFMQRAAEMYGCEWKLDLHPHPVDWLHWECGFSYVRGRFLEQIEGTHNMPLIPPARMTHELRAECLPNGRFLKNLSLHVSWERTWGQKRAFTAFQTETETSGFDLFGAGVQASIMHQGNKVCQMIFAVDNLTDAAYQQHLSRLKYTAVNFVSGRSGVYNMGRNYMIKFSIPFAKLIKE